MSVKDLLAAVRSGALSPEEAKRMLREGGTPQTRIAPVEAQARSSPRTGGTPVAEPIAIVGMSARYPGAPDLDSFWALLVACGDAVTEIPAARWPVSDFYDPSLPREGKLYAKWLGALDDIDCFDPLFFAISPGEADYMDPQHRLFMEEAYRAFEDAGYAGDALNGGNCGVYFGIMSREYGDLLIEHPELGGNTTGMSSSIGAARVSYYLNLKGPAIPVDTACSSSLVAAHLACQALRAQEIDMALVGGSTVYVSPRTYAGMCAAGMLSPTGRCRAFDDDGDGFVPGEGVGAIVLKRLSDAEADHDSIRGLIVASGINQDGRTNGITAPSKASQIALTGKVYRRFGIDPETISYVEMHGTGTNLGDPIELSALSTTFREYTGKRNFCAIGSVKTNVGHTSAAAGVAGIHKVLLCMRHGMLVPSLHFGTPNRHFDFDASPFYVNAVFRPWTAEDDRPLRAAVSSFGYSGTNAHLVVEQYRGTPPAVAAVPRHLFPFSAMDAAALRRNVAHVLGGLRSRHDIALADIAYTLQVGRAQREHRLGVLADDREQLLARLEGFLACRTEAGVWHGGGEDSPIVRAFADRSDLVDLQRGWLDRDPARLLELWVKGLDADWCTLRRETPARRVPLPTYRFAHERYWLDFAGDNFGRRKPSAPAGLESATTCILRFSGDEFFLAGHRVGGRRVLPAAHCLEIARGALRDRLDGTAAQGLELFDVTWRRPIIADEDVDAAHPLTVEVATMPRPDGAWAFALRIDGVEHCSGQGRALAAAEIEVCSSALPGAAVRPDELYALLASMGIDYGEANRGIVALHADRFEAEARLALPDSAPVNGFVLHPTLIDSALQATLGVALCAAGAGADDIAGPSLPFALESLRIFAPTSARMIARVRQIPGEGALRRYDLDLFEADAGGRAGRLCVQMRGFTSVIRRSEAETAAPPSAAPQLHLLAPVWRRFASAASDPVPDSAQARFAGTTLVIGAGPTQWQAMATACTHAVPLLPAGTFRADGASSAIAAALDAADGPIDRVLWFSPTPADGVDTDSSASARILFDLIKALLARRHDVRALEWTLVTVATQAVSIVDPVSVTHAALEGLVGSMAKEYPHWKVRMLDIDEDRMLPASVLAQAPCLSGGEVAALRDGAWWSRHLVEVRAEGDAAPVYREGGLYVAIGGAGGVGEAWTEWMIRRYRAHVVWIGRRDEDADIRARLDRLAALGPRPLYLAADASDAEALLRARDVIRASFDARRVDGVVHSAVVLDDSSLANMTGERFLATLRAKVDVSVNLVRAFGEESLDFVLFFSSMQSFTKAAGQSNYAAGCTFKDAFARALARRLPGMVRTVNWGYWGGTGIVATDEYRERMARIGLGSIEPEEGMAALERLLASPLPQLGVLKTLRADVAAAIVVPDDRMRLIAAPSMMPGQVSGPTVPPHPAAAAVEGDASALREAQDAFDRTLAELLWLAAHRLLDVLDVASLSALSARIDPQYREWLAETTRVLAAHGRLREAEGVTFLAPLEDDISLDVRWAAELAALRPHSGAALVEATLVALPDILSGAVPATDVVFRDPSMEQVEGVYRGTPVADYYNGIVADELVHHLRNRVCEGRSFRILEIGAGTGGTSALLFEHLRPWSERIAEYLYTDLSQAFLLHAEAQFREAASYLRCGILDIEKPLEAQGVAIGAYDAVVATNVLHATRDIRNAIRNAKAALAPGGVLLLNEISRKSLFAHLTFGLLKGWWLAEDAALRIVGSPVLAPDTWNRVLEGEGFRPVRFPAAAAHAHGQQVIAAYSDGAILQRIETDAGAAQTDVASAAMPATPVDTKSEAAGALRERVAALVAGTVGAVLKLDPARIDPRVKLERYGLDSILAVQMTAQLNRTLDGVRSTLFIEYQTIDALVEHLLSTRREDLVRALGAGITAVDRAPSAPAKPAAMPERSPAMPAQDAAASEAIAIVAISGRFPRADSIEALWERVLAGESCVQEVPASRWDHAQYYDPNRSRIGKTYCRWGGFIDGVDEFDPLFFDFSPAAADTTDPQIRLFLQTTWDLLERAGMTRESIERDHGSRVGVFVGAMYQQYQTLEMDYVMHAGLSLSSYSAICNRVSNFFDFKGPSVAVDTQCSSGLVAVHMARQSLLAGECEMAVAGAVNLILSPKKYIGLSIPMMLGSHDRCRSFGDGGDGFLPSEGVGAVLLKPLARAVEDRDPILAVLRTTAQSHGGRGIGYGTQDPNAKYSLIGRCVDQSGLDAQSISWVEAAATGTAMSDAMEASALTRAFSERTTERDFCALGTVKSNLGHSESASGLAQLAKVVMQLRHRILPPLVPFERLNPDIDFADSPFRLQVETAPWERPVGVGADGRPRQWPRRALIDCFGGGGSLACAIVEEYAPELPTAASYGLAAPSAPHGPAGPQLVPLSARTPERLRAVVERLRAAIAAAPALTLQDIAYTLQLGREAMICRLALLVDGREGLLTTLDAVLRDDEAALADCCWRSGDDDAALPVWDAEADAAVIDALATHRLDALAALWCRGTRVDWRALHADGAARIAILPGYPFERRRCWLPEGGSPDYRESLARLEAAYAADVGDADLRVTVHREIGAVLGLPAAELPLDSELVRFELPHVLLPRLRHHLQRRTGLLLDAARLADCRTVGDVLALVDAPPVRPQRQATAASAKRAPVARKTSAPSKRPKPASKPAAKPKSTAKSTAKTKTKTKTPKNTAARSASSASKKPSRWSKVKST